LPPPPWFTVHASKTEHHSDGGVRVVPIFEELHPYLLDVFGQAGERQCFVITRYRKSNANLRTQLGKIIKRAGVKQWPKLFQNLRSTRETELMQQYGIPAACEWIGNSPQVAMKHYAQVTEEDFARAIGGTKSGTIAARNPARQQFAANRNDRPKGVARPLIHVQHVLHARDELRAGLGGMHQ
jgi:hypothetical protein